MRFALFLLLIADLLLGIAHIAMLPPWEGFDETAHYSYLQQIADIGKLPRLGKAFISLDVENYARNAPLPYAGAEGLSEITYSSIFRLNPEDLSAVRELIHFAPGKSRAFLEGQGANWQAQHPPLYYALLSPVYLWTKHWDWRSHLLILRGVSYLLAWLGLISGVWAACGAKGGDSEGFRPTWVALSIAAWPLFVFSWLPDTARLGNDSLCVLLASLCFAVVLRPSAHFRLQYLLLGVFLGLGCLTKALFVPFSLGLIAFICCRSLLVDHRGAKRSLIDILLALAPLLLIAGWWYMANWYEFGSLLGTAEGRDLEHQGGLLKGLRMYGALHQLIRGAAAFVTTFAWCGTWSWVRPPIYLIVPAVLMIILGGIAYFQILYRHKASSLAWVALWVVSPVCAGFFYHILLRMALGTGGFGSGGYYLNFMVCFLAVCLSFLLQKFWSMRKRVWILALLISHGIFLILVSAWLQLLLFSGIAYKGPAKTYMLSERLPACLGLPMALSRMELLASPQMGWGALMAGLVIAAIGFGLGLRNLSHARQ